MKSEDEKLLILAAVAGLGLLWWLRRRESFSGVELPVVVSDDSSLVERKVFSSPRCSLLEWVPEVEKKARAIGQFPSLTRYRA